jgi:DNA-binding MarR family transcriptional regulator
MVILDDQLDTIEKAMHVFFGAIKRPAYWTKLLNQSSLNIDRPSGSILQRLASSEPNWLNVQELADSLHVEAPSVTRKTQELEASGLVERSHSKEDRRVVIIKLTSKGKDLAQTLQQAHRQILSQTLSLWEAEERQAFSSLFEKFSENFEKIIKS